MEVIRPPSWMLDENGNYLPSGRYNDVRPSRQHDDMMEEVYIEQTVYYARSPGGSSQARFDSPVDGTYDRRHDRRPRIEELSDVGSNSGSYAASSYKGSDVGKSSRDPRHNERRHLLEAPPRSGSVVSGASKSSYAPSKSGHGYAGSEGGRSYVHSDDGRSYVRSDDGRSYVRSDDGRSYAGSNGGRSYAGSNSGQSYLHSDDGRSYAGSNSGRSYAGSNSGRSYAGSNSGQSYVSDAPPSRVSAQSSNLSKKDISILNWANQAGGTVPELKISGPGDNETVHPCESASNVGSPRAEKSRSYHVDDKGHLAIPEQGRRRHKRSSGGESDVSTDSRRSDGSRGSGRSDRSDRRDDYHRSAGSDVSTDSHRSAKSTDSHRSAKSTDSHRSAKSTDSHRSNHSSRDKKPKTVVVKSGSAPVGGLFKIF